MYTISRAYEPISGLRSTVTYNADGGLPAETVGWNYTQNGVPTVMGGAGDYMTSDSIDPFGHLTSINLGDMPNQVVQTTHYDQATGRIIKQYIDKESGSTHVDEITNLFNPAGLVTATADVQDGASTDLQCFGYNQLGQLTDAWSDTAGTHTAASPSVPNIGGCTTTTPSAATIGGPAPYWHSYTYNAAGNRGTFTEHATDGNPAHDTTHTSGYTGATGQGGQPDAVQSVANAGPAGNTRDTYGYDPAGNTTTRSIAGGANQTITYTAQNRTSTVTGQAGGTSASYRYDADGNLLLQRDTTGSSTKVTLYLDNEQVTLDVGTGSLSGLRYYPVDSGATEVRSSTGALTYEFGNGQGTHSLTIDAGASQAETRRYLTPYGQTRGTTPAAWLDNRAFVNQPVDPATGLNLLGARNYDPVTGHFLQLDPMLEFTEPNQLGGYSYAADNPVTSSDPSGLCPKDRCDGYGQNVPILNDAPDSTNVGGTDGDNLGAALFGPPPAGDERKIVKTSIKAPGNGIVVAKFFISDAKFYGIAHGDGRGFSLDSNASFRVAIAWNTDTGEISISVQPSCVDVLGCSTPLNINLTDSDMTVHNNVHISGGDGALNLKLNLQDAVTRFVPHIDQDLKMSLNGGHSTVTISGDPFPDFEVNQYTNDGGADYLARSPHANPGGPEVNLLPSAPRRNLTWHDGYLGTEEDRTKLSDLANEWCREEPMTPACLK